MARDQLFNVPNRRRYRRFSSARGRSGLVTGMLALALAVAGLSSPLEVAAVSAATTTPVPCLQPLAPKLVLNTASTGALATGKPRAVALPTTVPVDAKAVLLQVRSKGSKAGRIDAVAYGSSLAATTVAAVNTRWVSTTALLVAPTQKLNVTFFGPTSSTTNATLEVVGFVADQDCFNTLPFAPAVDTRTGTGLSAAAPLAAGTSTPVSLQGSTFLPDATGSAYASVGISSGATATTVQLVDDSVPANTVDSWTLSPNDSVRSLVLLPPSATHHYTVLTSGGSAALSMTPVGWYSTASDFAGSQDLVLDSANGIGAKKGALLLGSTLTFPIPADIPKPAAIVVSVLASANQDSTLSVWPAGTTRPATVTVHASKGHLVRQQLLLAPGPNGAFSIREDSGSTNIVASVIGWVPFPAPVNTPVDGITHITTADQIGAVQPDQSTGETSVAYTGADHVDVGDVLVSGQTADFPDGYIGVVTDVSTAAMAPAATGSTGPMAAADPSTTVTMQQASLLDALPNADMDSATLAVASDDPAPDVQPPLPPDDPNGVDPSTTSPSPAPAAAATTQSSSSITPAAASTSGSLPGGTTFCSANGGWRIGTSLKLSGGVNLTGHWRPGTATTVDFNFDGGLSGNMSLNVGAGASCSASTTLQGPSLPTITFTVGPVPVVVRPVLSLGLSASGSVGGAVKVQTNVDLGLKTGVSYSGGRWTPYFTPRANFPTTVDARLGGSAKVEVTPKLTLMIYGVAGPFVQLGGVAQANINLLQSPWWTASADINADVGLTLDVWFFHASFDAVKRTLLHFSAGAATSPYPGPTITTSSLPNGTVGRAYSAGLQSSGGATPTSWYLVGGSLPAGLSLNSGGVISGTPSTTQTSTFTVRATSASGYRSAQDRTLSISVGTGPSVSTGSLPDGTIGAGYSASLQAAGGTAPYTWSLVSGGLPAGLNLASNGTISGTPSTAQTATFTVRAVDAAGRASNNATLSIAIGSSAPPPPTTWTEQEGSSSGVNTFLNYHNASGMGPHINYGQYVQVSCKVYDPYIASVNPDGYWYRIASSPWNNAYYAPANTFFNGDPVNGPYTHNTDFAVPNC